MNAKRVLGFLAILLAGALTAAPVRADDTEIYGAANSGYRPNVLILFDNNASMSNNANAGPPYDPNTTYTCKNSSGVTIACPYVANTIYKLVNTNQSGGGYVSMGQTLTATTPSCASARTGLATYGTWSSAAGSGLKSNGTCGNGGSNVIYLGNLLNYNSQASTVVAESEANVIIDALKNIVPAMAGTVNFGLEVFNSNKSGGYIVKPIQDLRESDGSVGDPNSATSKIGQFMSVLPASPATSTSWPLLVGNGRPLAEALYDGGAYFKGVGPIIGGGPSYASPIIGTCQKNYVIILTNGDSDGDNSPKLGQTTALGLVGDFDNDGKEPGAWGTGTHYLDDVAKFLYEKMSVTGLSSVVGIKTYSIQIFSSGSQLLQLTSDGATGTHGRGDYYSASSASAISDALLKSLTSIVLEVTTSFVAPVVPVNPENRTYSGTNIYIGLFKPQIEPFWLGNLKKYAINSNSQIVDKNGAVATDASGAFLTSSISYWSTSQDGGEVAAGGVGGLLASRTLSTRKLYTYLGSKTALTDASNAFNTTNITPAMLFGAGSTDTTNRNNVVNFVYGYDVNGSDPTKTRTVEINGTAVPWILGDILHSRPVIINYLTKTTKRSVIFVGSNDGMLHAFEDNYGTNAVTDGQELWGFIPPDVFPNLKNLASTSGAHNYFVDGSPKLYLVDANNDGEIKKSDGDQAILIFGERRGGDAYYALDVTDPDNPVYLWRLVGPVSAGRLGVSADVSELGLSFSDPSIGKVNISGTSTPAFFIGGGYDATAEDSLPPAADTKGRGVYAFKIFPNAGSLSPTKIWEYSYTTSVTNDSGNSLDDMTYSIPSTVTILDTDANGYIDRLYVGDLGGRMWRFMVGDTNPANWTGKIVFKSNPGQDGTTGRKIFYPPDVTLQPATTMPATTVTTPSYPYGYRMLFFGTGDREHPQTSTSIMDRMYAVKDVVGDSTHNSVVTEGTSTGGVNLLVDVTLDALQLSGETTSQINTILENLEKSAGWYIDLNLNLGEKVLAPASIFAKVVSYSTYTPPAPGSVSASCTAQLGTARIYQVDYLTGEAVFNYDTTNDAGSGSAYASETNTRSLGGAIKDASGNVTGGNFFRRTDRVLTAGSGIPSGIVNTISELGGTKPCDAMGLAGVGGNLQIVQVKCNATRSKIYWSPRY